MDPLILLVAATLVAVLLASAALHKLVHRSDFRQALIAYQLVPGSLIALVALILPVLELASAAALLFESFRGSGGLSAAALFALYALAMIVNLLRGRRDLACGCSWGVSSARAEPTVSAGLVARNLVLVGVTLVLALTPADRAPGWFDFLNGALGGVLIVLLWATADRLVANGKLMSLRRAS